MKKLAYSIVACLAVAGSALAGQEMKESKEFKQPVEPCFKDTELQIDVFGSYSSFTHVNNPYVDQTGGGLGVNYFFMRYLGIGADGDVIGGGAHGVWSVSGKLIARYPIEVGGLCLAPYVFVGGGGQFDGTPVGTWLAGGGLEWRAVPEKFGIFAEGRYTWAGNEYDSAQARLGVRFVF